MEIMEEMRLRAPLANFAHRQAVAGGMDRHFGHVVFHQEESAAAGTFEVFVSERVGNVARIVAGAFVGDADVEAVGANMKADMDAFCLVHLVAMLDGVDNRFFQGQANAENFLIVEAELSQLFFDKFLDVPCFVEIAGNDEFDGSIR